MTYRDFTREELTKAIKSGELKDINQIVLPNTKENFMEKAYFYSFMGMYSFVGKEYLVPFRVRKDLNTSQAFDSNTIRCKEYDN